MGTTTRTTTAAAAPSADVLLLHDETSGEATWSFPAALTSVHASCCCGVEEAAQVKLVAVLHPLSVMLRLGADLLEALAARCLIQSKVNLTHQFTWVRVKERVTAVKLIHDAVFDCCGDQAISNWIHILNIIQTEKPCILHLQHKTIPPTGDSVLTLFVLHNARPIGMLAWVNSKFEARSQSSVSSLASPSFGYSTDPLTKVAKDSASEPEIVGTSIREVVDRLHKPCPPSYFPPENEDKDISEQFLADSPLPADSVFLPKVLPPRKFMRRPASKDVDPYDFDEEGRSNNLPSSAFKRTKTNNTTNNSESWELPNKYVSILSAGHTTIPPQRRLQTVSQPPADITMYSNTSLLNRHVLKPADQVAIFAQQKSMFLAGQSSNLPHSNTHEESELSLLAAPRNPQLPVQQASHPQLRHKPNNSTAIQQLSMVYNLPVSSAQLPVMQTVVNQVPVVSPLLLTTPVSLTTLKEVLSPRSLIVSSKESCRT